MTDIANTLYGQGQSYQTTPVAPGTSSMAAALYGPTSAPVTRQAAPARPAAPTTPPSTNPVDVGKALANQLYPGTETTPAPAAAAPLTAESATAETLYGEGSPAEYALEVPDAIGAAGWTLDQTAMAAFLPIARELKLSQAQAQKLLNIHAAHSYQLSQRGR